MELLQSAIAVDDRDGFLLHILSWEIESEKQIDKVTTIDAVKPGFGNAFYLAQTRIHNYTRVYVDDAFVFRDVLRRKRLRGMPMQRFDRKYIVMLGIGLLSLRSSLWKTLDQEGQKDRFGMQIILNHLQAAVPFQTTQVMITVVPVTL